jgi:hypothetical protein
MIQENVVSLSLRLDKFYMYKDFKPPDDYVPGEKPMMAEFFILPTYSYFGDY